jgi:hypothetical protein
MTSDGAPDESDLVALMLGTMRLLDEFAAAIRAPDTDAAAVDDQLVAAALGLLSVRRTLERWQLDAVADLTGPAAAEPAAQGKGDWLR